MGNRNAFHFLELVLRQAALQHSAPRLWISQTSKVTNKRLTEDRREEGGRGRGCPLQLLPVEDITRRQPFPLLLPVSFQKGHVVTHLPPPTATMQALGPARPGATAGPRRGPRTCAVLRLEALPLHRGVGIEPEEQAAARSHHGVRLLAAAETAEDGGQAVGSVVRFQVVVGTFLVLLDLKLIERLETEKHRVRQGPGTPRGGRLPGGRGRVRPAAARPAAQGHGAHGDHGDVSGEALALGPLLVSETTLGGNYMSYRSRDPLQTRRRVRLV